MAKKKKKKKKGNKNLGKWGSVKFIVSSNTVRTFTDLKWNTTINYDVKERKKKVSKVTFKGIAPDEFSYKMHFSVFNGLTPMKEINKINKLARKHKAYRLMIGGKKYGKYKTVITSISRDMKYYDNKGNCWIADVQVNLKEKP